MEHKRKREEDETTQSKKRKQVVTTFVDEEDEDDDILISGWFYLDVDGAQQGPFRTREMKEWLIAGFFSSTTRVKRVTAPEYKTIAECEEFKPHRLRVVERPEEPSDEDKEEEEQPENGDDNSEDESEQPQKPGEILPHNEPVNTDDKMAWQQYQEYQQYQFYLYLQYCQQEQEKERKKLEKVEAKKVQEDVDDQLLTQQRELEAQIEREKVEQEQHMNPYYEQFGTGTVGAFYDPAFEPEHGAIPTAVPAVPKEPEPVQMMDAGYSQRAFFNVANGRFTGETPEQHWRSKNVPTDREGRMMAHYFDFEAYQNQMREATAHPTKRPKVTKKMIKSYKKKKIDKQRNRILMM
jgi:hypothetical protein